MSGSEISLDGDIMREGIVFTMFYEILMILDLGRAGDLHFDYVLCTLITLK